MGNTGLIGELLGITCMYLESSCKLARENVMRYE